MKTETERKLAGVWVLEWSNSQKCFHLHTVEEMLSDNERAAYQNRAADYIPIAFSDNYDEIKKFSTGRFKSLNHLKGEKNEL